MAISDLDGTLLQPDGSFRVADLAAMELLAAGKIPRVIATGRSLFSARRVLEDTFPIDFLVFSAGAGVLDWAGGELIRRRTIPARLVERAVALLQELRLDFMVHAPIPDNHRFHWVAAGGAIPIFNVASSSTPVTPNRWMGTPRVKPAS